MRPRSIVGPLILIALGALLLVNNLQPQLSLWTSVVRFWPFILIAWGVVRLLEIVIWALRRKPLPPQGVSGGEWALIILFTIVGAGYSAARARFGGWGPYPIRVHGLEFFGRSFDYPLVERIVPATALQRVVIENLRGATRILGANVSTVKVSGRKTVRAFDSNSAQQAHDMTPIEISSSDGLVVVRTNLERAGPESRATADIDVVVPRAASLEARGREGEFEVSDITGNVNIRSENASVRAQNLGGELSVEVRRGDSIRAINVKGPVEIRGRGQTVQLEEISSNVMLDGAFYETELRKIAGPVRFQGPFTQFSAQACPNQLRLTRGDLVADNLTGPITVLSQSKDVQLRAFHGPLEITLERGDIELYPSLPLAEMRVTTRAGNITVHLPPESRFAIQAQVRRGEIKNYWGSPLQEKGEEERAWLLTGKVGEGPLLSLQSERGAIIIRRAGETEESPALEDRRRRLERREE